MVHFQLSELKRGWIQNLSTEKVQGKSTPFPGQDYAHFVGELAFAQDLINKPECWVLCVEHACPFSRRLPTGAEGREPMCSFVA